MRVPPRATEIGYIDPYLRYVSRHGNYVYEKLFKENPLNARSTMRHENRAYGIRI
jgi:hypothetical protein